VPTRSYDTGFQQNADERHGGTVEGEDVTPAIVIAMPMTAPHAGPASDARSPVQRLLQPDHHIH